MGEKKGVKKNVHWTSNNFAKVKDDASEISFVFRSKSHAKNAKKKRTTKEEKNIKPNLCFLVTIYFLY